MNCNSGLSSAKCPPLDTETRHPCAGCDALLTLRECAGYAFGGKHLAPLCTGCFEHGAASPEFTALVQRAVTLGHTLPAIRRLFASDGLALPVTPEENQRAAAVLHGLDAWDAAQHRGAMQ